MQEPLYPFSKNRYFKKKRIRAVDFQRDQAFADHKLSFLNHWIFGTGIAFGLGVQRIDSDSLLVEPGLAIDAQGRFLIVDEPTICRVRALQGFEHLQGETALLWLSYDEELLDPMFVADDEGHTSEYAVAKERFSFSLSQEASLPISAVEQQLLSTHILFEDDEIRIVQSIPRILSSHLPVQLQLHIQCFSLEPVDILLRYAPDFPGFSNANGTAPLFEEQLHLHRGETTRTLTLYPVQPAQTVFMHLTDGGFSLKKRGIQLTLQHPVCDQFTVTEHDLSAAFESQFKTCSTQELWDEQPMGIPIAAIRLVRYEQKSLLDDVIPISPRHCACVPMIQSHIQQVLSRFHNISALSQPFPSPSVPCHGSSNKADKPKEHNHAHVTGTTLISVPAHTKAGCVLVSEEIPHGLGPGDVYITFGVEHIYPLANSQRNGTDVLLGDVSLFTQPSGSYEQDFDRGVRVHPDKGTFELAVRLHTNLRQPHLRLRWFAWRTQEHPTITSSCGTLLGLEPDVIHVHPGETVNFTPIFPPGKSAPCEFAVVGKRDGIITRDGVYTAPDRSGLCQIYAQVQGQPQQRANAFIIVEEREEDDHEPAGV